jgi:hypothetical protein
MTVWALTALAEPDHNYWYDVEQVWIPAPKFQTHSALLKYFYVTQLSVWIVTCLSHVFFEEAHKDYLVMFVHHLVTIFLVSTSYASNTLRIGLLIVLLHDASDISVDLLKMCNYCKLDGAKNLFLVEITFTLMMITWAYFRLYFFPFVIMRTVIVDMVPNVCPNGFPWNNIDPWCEGKVGSHTQLISYTYNTCTHNVAHTYSHTHSRIHTLHMYTCITRF